MCCCAASDFRFFVVNTNCLRIHLVMFRRVVVIAAADKAYSDISILSRRLSGFDVNVFGSISEQIQMANEDRSHRFIRPGEGDRNVDKKATNDALPVESQDSQRDDKHLGEHVKVDKHEPRQRNYSPRLPSSHSDRRSKSQKVGDQPEVKRSHNRPGVTGEEKQERKAASRTESSTVVSTPKLVGDDRVSKLKKSAAVKQRSQQSLDQHESNAKSSDVSNRDRGKKSGASSDARQQLAVDQPSTENSETKVKKSSESRNGKKVSSARSQSSGMKSNGRRVKSVVAKSSVEAHVGSGAGKLAASRTSPVIESDGEVTRRVLRSFDEVHCICLYFAL